MSASVKGRLVSIYGLKILSVLTSSSSQWFDKRLYEMSVTESSFIDHKSGMRGAVERPRQ